MTREIDDEIDFERAEFSGPAGNSPGAGTALRCVSCAREIRDVYFAVGDAAVCDSCRAGLSDHFDAGAGGAGLLRASVFGVGAGLAGAILWTVITEMSGYQIGLVALVVSWMVGTAVHRGSGGFGGPLYQGIAVVLTYLAIVSTYMPGIFGMLESQSRAAAVSESQDSESTVYPAEDFELTPELVILVVGLAVSLPFLTLLDAPIGSLIIAFALYDAWRRNKRVSIAFSGPLRVGARENL